MDGQYTVYDTPMTMLELRNKIQKGVHRQLAAVKVLGGISKKRYHRRNVQQREACPNRLSSCSHPSVESGTQFPCLLGWHVERARNRLLSNNR